MKKFWALLLITAVFIVSGCGSAGNGKTADGKITVAASFYPMAEFARAVGGSHAEVYTMIGDGIEPHDWEPSARDLTRLAKAKVFVYNGGVEPWAQPAGHSLRWTPLRMKACCPLKPAKRLWRNKTAGSTRTSG